MTVASMKNGAHQTFPPLGKSRKCGQILAPFVHQPWVKSIDSDDEQPIDRYLQYDG